MKNIIVILLIIVSCSAFPEDTVSRQLTDTTLIAGEQSDTTESTSRRFFGQPLGLSPAADLRSIDGLFLGLSFKTKEDENQLVNRQEISVLKSLRTKAIILEYNAEWISVLKNTDIIINSMADIRGNILNFFGRGNETLFDQSGDFRRFYRVNFSNYRFEPALRFRPSTTLAFSIGPAIQHVVFDPNDNIDRFINSANVAGQYADLREDKTHAGLVLNLNWDTRSHKDLPRRGYHFSLLLQGFEGMNEYSRAFAQAFPQISFYKSLDNRGRFVLANRTGAGFTIGNTEFYQSAFLGSQDNLLGFRKFRFAGDHLLYNNLELRIAFSRFIHRTLQDKVGLIGFYDVGRVWVRKETSSAIHHGYGAGAYVAVSNRWFLRGVAGFSEEGFQPTVSLRQRF